MCDMSVTPCYFFASIPSAATPERLARLQMLVKLDLAIMTDSKNPRRIPKLPFTRPTCRVSCSCNQKQK